MALSVASQYVLPGCGDQWVWVRGPGWPDNCVRVIAVYALRLNSRAGAEGSTVSSLICHHWLILGLETLSRCLNHWQQMASCCMHWPVINGSVHNFTHTAWRHRPHLCIAWRGKNQIIFFCFRCVLKQCALTVIKLLRFFCINICCYSTRFYNFCNTVAQGPPSVIKTVDGLISTPHETTTFTMR